MDTKSETPQPASPIERSTVAEPRGPTPETSDVNIMNKKTKNKKIIIICLLIGLPFIFVFIGALVFSAIIAFETHSQQTEKIPEMQAYLDAKYGKDENFQFTGNCKGGSIGGPVRCYFTSDATKNQEFYVKGDLSFSDNYLDVKFKDQAEDYFNNIFRDVSAIDNRIEKVQVASVDPSSNHVSSQRESTYSKSFEDFINNNAINLELIISVKLDSADFEKQTDGSWQVKQPIQTELENKVFSILQGKQVTRNIEEIAFNTELDEHILSFCMSYTEHPKSNSKCAQY